MFFCLSGLFYWLQSLLLLRSFTIKFSISTSSSMGGRGWRLILRPLVIFGVILARFADLFQAGLETLAPRLSKKLVVGLSGVWSGIFLFLALVPLLLADLLADLSSLFWIFSYSIYFFFYSFSIFLCSLSRRLCSCFVIFLGEGLISLMSIAVDYKVRSTLAAS